MQVAACKPWRHMPDKFSPQCGSEWRAKSKLLDFAQLRVCAGRKIFGEPVGAGCAMDIYHYFAPAWLRA